MGIVRLMGHFDSKEKQPINLLYFGGIFLFVAPLYSLLALRNPLPVFFFIYGIGQTFLEVIGLLFIGWILRRWTPLCLYRIYIGLTFLILLCHFADFIMLHLQDIGIGYAFRCFFSGGLSHFIANVQALNLNATMAFLIIATFLTLPFIGLLFYSITKKRGEKSLSLNHVGLLLLSTLTFLLAFDRVAKPPLSPLIYARGKQALPLGFTFLRPEPHSITLTSSLPPLSQEIPPLPKLETKPNLYFFIIESLRCDAIDELTAPCLSAFGDEFGRFPFTYSNANATHLSWYAIFHSNYPFYWKEAEKGSLPLKILKEQGYKIHIYSSANFHYYGMDELLFGKGRYLADKIEEYSENWSLKPWQRDRLALDSFLKDLPDRKTGHIYLFFFDATHAEYSFPEEEFFPFTPITREIDYLTLSQSRKSLPLLQNRYRNSIYYVDSLLGKFFDALRSNGIFDEAIIAITGDHGEEFYEENSFFHATHLNRYQTNVPIFCKFQQQLYRAPSGFVNLDSARQSRIAAKTPLVSHIDLFPTVLHFLFKQEIPLFHGQSLYSAKRPAYLLSVMQNTGSAPVEFVLRNEDEELRARFLTQNSIEILSETDLSKSAQILNSFFSNGAPQEILCK